MGACFSQDYITGRGDLSARTAPTAKVVSSSGKLREYALPVTVSVVIEAESSASSSGFFLCNSDMLCYEELIPAMGLDEELAKDQIYFSLPTSRLGKPLSASDMAALAVKASLALQNSGSSDGERSRRGRKSQISPVLKLNNRREEVTIRLGSDAGSTEKMKQSPPTSTNPARRYQRSYSSKKFKRAVRSFRIRLSTIQEGAESVHSEQCYRRS